jgi:hypothetical protein
VGLLRKKNTSPNARRSRIVHMCLRVSRRHLVAIASILIGYCFAILWHVVLSWLASYGLFRSEWARWPILPDITFSSNGFNYVIPILTFASLINGLPPFIVCLLCYLVLHTRWQRTSDSMQSSYCMKCEYDLRGNTSGRCPECGTPIDPKQFTRLLGVNSVSTNPTNQRSANDK